MKKIQDKMKLHHEIFSMALVVYFSYDAFLETEFFHPDSDQSDVFVMYENIYVELIDLNCLDQNFKLDLDIFNLDYIEEEIQDYLQTNIISVDDYRRS
jgi:hypothetical protein